MEKSRLLKMVCVAFAFSFASASGSPAQTFTQIVSFDVANGASPQSSLIQATDGNFYGTAAAGGANQGCGSSFGCGTVFQVTPAGTQASFYSFCSLANCADGAFPVGGLIQGTDGNFYGTTSAGGSSTNCDLGCGTVFTINSTTDALTTLHSFSGADGSQPFAGSLVYGLDGNFYGTTAGGGANGNYGTLYNITPAGTLTTLYSFCSDAGCADGYAPYSGLVLGTDGNFYGTTYYGGANGYGTAFLFNPTAGTLTTLYSFCSQAGCTDGDGPYGGLFQGTDGNFYGTTEFGGANNDGTVFQLNAGTAPPTLTTLYNFSGSDGRFPQAGVIQASDSNFYGVTIEGGANGDGTVFMITSTGTLTTLYSFCSQEGCTDGQNPYGGLVQVSNGTFYGTTYYGGTSTDCYSGGCGTLFNLSNGLAHFVETQLPSGLVGASVTILGNDLTGATSVSFNGTTAKFTAKNSAISTKVPSGATTGKVTVTTAKGIKLKTNVAFRVSPRLKSFSPTKGAVGQQVEINGVSLTQTNKVSFGSVAATDFSVNSDTKVTATVPAGATTGKITITTAGGVATTAKSFTVTE